jgi:DNA excision repair protein ERCC-2
MPISVRASAIWRGDVQAPATRGGCLLAQAPTGIGKTVGTLFPLLKASAGHGVDKVFFLAAKTSGRADGAGRAWRRSAKARQLGSRLRTLELAAQVDKSCVQSGQGLPRRIPARWRKGFYDRLPAARSRRDIGAGR